MPILRKNTREYICKPMCNSCEWINRYSKFENNLYWWVYKKLLISYYKLVSLTHSYIIQISMLCPTPHKILLYGREGHANFSVASFENFKYTMY